MRITTNGIVTASTMQGSSRSIIFNLSLEVIFAALQKGNNVTFSIQSVFRSEIQELELFLNI